MRLIDFYYPYATDWDSQIDPWGRPRTATGIAFNRSQGILHVVEPASELMPAALHYVTPDGCTLGSLGLAELGIEKPFGVADDPREAVLWLSDCSSRRLVALGRGGKVVREISLEGTELRLPVVLARAEDDGFLWVGSCSQNLVLCLERDGRVRNRFEHSPFPGAVLRGVADRKDDALLLSYSRSIPETKGFLGAFGLYEVDRSTGRCRKLDLGRLGMCALDIALSPDGSELYAIGREFALGSVRGDHAHVFRLDLTGTANSDVPNLRIVQRMLEDNNLAPDDSGEPRTLRWPQLPVAVFAEELPERVRQQVRDVCREWSEQSGEAIRFCFVGQPPAEGIVVRPGAVASAEGRPGAGRRVVVTLPSPDRLPCHPHGAGLSQVLRNLARHEIGHAIGFRGHSPRFRVDAMNSISGYSNRISAEEAAFVKMLYHLPPATPEASIDYSILGSASPVFGTASAASSTEGTP